jgi:hypothetical protein
MKGLCSAAVPQGLWPVCWSAVRLHRGSQPLWLVCLIACLSFHPSILILPSFCLHPFKCSQMSHPCARESNDIEVAGGVACVRGGHKRFACKSSQGPI